MLLTISSTELCHCAGSSLGIVLAEEEGRLSPVPAGGQVRIESVKKKYDKNDDRGYEAGKRNQGDK